MKNKSINSRFFSVTNLYKNYESKSVLSNINFMLQKGEISCFLGASGCGKTTLLRAIAGFDTVEQGTIILNGCSLVDEKQALAPEQRNVGMVFQDNALFPHLNVIDNICFGLHALSKQSAHATALEWLEKVGLSGRDNAMPYELSGGEQQRVALARTLAPAPALVLLDEPFSNLDVELRESLGREVRDIFKSSNTTAILVTHDQHEAFAMADTVGVLKDGQLQQWGSSYDVYHRPINRYVAEFVGQGVLLNGKMSSVNQVETALGSFPLSQESVGRPLVNAGDEVDVLIRPDDVLHDDMSPLQAKVKAKLFRGAEFLYTLELDSGENILALVPSHHNHVIGESIGYVPAIDHVVVFPCLK